MFFTCFRSILLLKLFLTIPSIIAQQYALDNSFGSHGIIKTDFGINSGTYNRVVPSIHVAVQPDGKIIVVGDAYKNRESTNAESTIAIVRYNPDGALDRDFGNEGKVIILPLARFNCFGIDLALQKDGKIVIAGRIFDRNEYWLGEAAVVRLNQDGSIDESFGIQGVAREHNEGLHWSNFFRVAIQEDGSIIACGNKGLDNRINNALDHCRAFLARYKSDGTLDESFGTQGHIETTIQVSNYGISRIEGREADEVYALRIQADGKVVAVGRIEEGSGC